MKSLLKIGLSVAALALVLVSCSNKDDERPVISVTTPTDGQNVFVAASFDVNIAFTDNEELESYTFSVSGNGSWSENLEGSLSGTSGSLQESVAIPGNADLGEYTWRVTCTDKEGNSAEESGTLSVNPS